MAWRKPTPIKNTSEYVVDRILNLAQISSFLLGAASQDFTL